MNIINDNEKNRNKIKTIKEIKLEMDNYGLKYHRYFTSIYKNKHGDILKEGRYKSHINKPKQAAKKAFKQICNKEEIENNKKIKFVIKECTRNSRKKYYAYEGEKIKFDCPIKVDYRGTTITYNYEYKVKKISLDECKELINVDFDDNDNDTISSCPRYL